LQPLGGQQAAQHPRAGERELQVQPVDTPDDREVGFRQRPRQVVDAATADTQIDRRLRRSIAAAGTDNIRSPAFELRFPRGDLIGVDVELR
jgi:hypothetical protein